MTAIRVVRASLYEVAIPLREPFAISGGTLRVRRSLVVELQDAEGARGFGEAAPFEAPFYSSETLASARACLQEWLLPRVVATPVADAQALHALLSHGVRGNRMARAGVETAWWDLYAVREHLALSEVVSRRLAALEVPPSWQKCRSHVECGVALGIPRSGQVDDLCRDVAAAVARGYRRVKLKIKPGWDVEPIQAALDVVRGTGVDIPLTVDANGAYDATRHVDALRRLDELGLLFVEQPFAETSLWDTVELSRVLDTPICLDESLTSDQVARQVLAMGGPTIWNLKVQRVGGLEEACRIYARAAKAGVRLWAGTMPETGLGAQATLALAGHAGFVFPSDLEPSERWYPAGADLVELEMEPNGRMPVPDARPPLQVERHGLLIHQLG